MMDKETVKQIINDFIDSVDKIQDFSISNEIEEIDKSTLDRKNVVKRDTGYQNLYLTAYKEQR